MRRFLRSPRLVICGGYVLVLALLALAAPALSSQRDVMSAAHRFLSPGADFWLGTDEFGRDILSRLIFGSRLSLGVSLGSTAIAGGVGALLGLAAGFYGRWMENGIMRLMDGILCFPPIVLAILVMFLLGPSLTNLTLTIGLLFVPQFARVAHGATLQVKELEYVEAARACGAPTRRIILVTILPNILAPLFVQFSLAMGNAVLLEAGLSFLGLGPPPNVSSWGRMVEQSHRYLALSPWGVVWPSLAIAGTVLALNILGDALRDLLDPRLRT